MKKINVLLAAALMAGSGLASAGQLTVGTATGGAGTNIGPVSISFAGDGSTVGFQNDISYNETALGQPTLAAQNAATCTRPAAGVIRVIKLDLGLVALPSASTNYCNATFPVPGATAAAVYPLTAANFATPPNGCSDAGGGSVVCTSTNGSVTVQGVPVPVGPSIAYNPAAGASAGTGGPVAFTGVGAVGSTGAGLIVATPSGGAVAGTATTIGNFVLSGADAGSFARTSAATLTFNQGTNTAQNITLTCTAGAAGRTANLQATETITGGATSQRFWVLNCPAGSATPVGPSIAYNPAAGASAGTGGPVAFTGVGAIGSTGAGQIAATPSGGSGAGTTTLGSFNLTGGDLLNFNVTSAATLTFTAGVNTPQNITLTCTAGAAARTTNLRAVETITGGATSERFWVLNCPAGAAAGTPPTITYVPAINSTTNIAAGASTTIQVGCPTDGSPCTGTGTGLAATSRLESLGAMYSGPMFSPLPSMLCQFVTEGGVATGTGILDFVAVTADPGDIRCTCPANTTSLPNETFIVSVSERIPASATAVTATRNFTIVCGGPPLVCPPATYINQAPGATINLTNGGAAAQVTAVSLVGASAGVSQTVSCATSNVSAGSTFTVTTAPSPLVISSVPALGGTVSASCTNSATTAGTATLTCTGTSTTPNCASTATFTLNCPGQGVPPPPSNFIPVPTLNEQGRILLAALVLLLGLGVVGFRMRG